MIEAQGDACAVHSYPDAPVAEIGDVLQALADPIRLSIVRSLVESQGEVSCGAFELPVSKPTLTHHFRVLREAGLIGHRMEGTRKLIHLRRAEIDAAHPGLVDAVVPAARARATTAG